MSTGILAETIRATILAGTVAPRSAIKSELAPAYDPGQSPEPAWAERSFAAAAPRHLTVAPAGPVSDEAIDAPVHTLGVSGDCWPPMRPV